MTDSLYPTTTGCILCDLELPTEVIEREPMHRTSDFRKHIPCTRKDKR